MTAAERPRLVNTLRQTNGCQTRAVNRAVDETGLGSVMIVRVLLEVRLESLTYSQAGKPDVQ
jgi:hypothetical protein